MGTRKHTKATAVERLASDSRAAREDARALAEDLGKLVTTASDVARARLQRNPYGTLLVAGGLGYVLGGGLPTRLVALGASLGLRQAGARAAMEVVTRMQAGMETPPASRGEP